MDLVPLLEIINKEKEYKVEKVWNYRKQEYDMQFLVYWKEYRKEYRCQTYEVWTQVPFNFLFILFSSSSSVLFFSFSFYSGNWG